MALTTKRIIALPSQTDPQEGDYLAIDNATSGTHKIPVGRIGVEVDDTLTEAGKAADAKATGDAIDELRTQLEVTGTASGAIASFPDGQSVIPALSVKVDLEPIQDLHGYDKPWSGGAGKNKANIDGATNLLGMALSNGVLANTLTDSKNQLALYAATYKESTLVERIISVAYSPSVGRWSGRCTINNTDFDRIRIWHSGSTQDLSAYIPCSVPTTGDYMLSINFLGVSPNVVGGFSFKEVQFEAGSTATSFEPYSNICPISGHTECVTEVCGKNLLPPKFYSGIGYNGAVGTVYTLTDITDTFTETDGVFSKSVSAWDGASMVSEALPNGSYRINIAVSSSGLRLTGYILDADYKVIRQFVLVGSGTSYSESRTISLTDGETYIALYVASNVSGSISFEQPQIEYGTTATAYEPYNGHTTTTPLGRTVYGGTLDVVSGALTVDRAMDTFDGNSTFAIQGSGSDYVQFRTTATNPIMIKSPYGSWVTNDDNFKCNALALSSSNPANSIRPANAVNPTAVYITMPSSIDTVDKMKEFATQTPIQYVYPLATPQTYTLTGQEVSTLLGDNNVWADSGDVEVVYIRDLNITINNLLNSNGTRSLGMMAMSAPTEATAEEPTEEQTEEPAEDDMR